MLQKQTGYTEGNKLIRNVNTTKLCKNSEEVVYENINNAGGNGTYSTAVSMQDNPAYQVNGIQPSNDSVYL